MRIITVAVLSFVLGATLVSLNGSQTSTPQSTPQSQPKQQLDFLLTDVVPVVPVPKGRIVLSGATFNGGIHRVDGTQCADCSFTNVTFVYGGGVYKMERSTFAGTSNIQLEGAAGNTVAFLNSMGLSIVKLQRPAAPPPNPNRPIIQTASFTEPTKMTLLSPYGQAGK